MIYIRWAMYTTICYLKAVLTMWLINYHVLILCLIFLESYALNCRSDGGPKEADLKNIYKKCLKTQNGRKTSKGNFDQDWKESRGQIQTSDWNRDRKDNNENRNSKHDRTNGKSKMSGNDDVMRRYDDRRGSERTGSNNNRMGNSNDRMGNPSDRMGRDNDMIGSNSDRMGNLDRTGNRNGRENTENSWNDKNRRDDYLNGRDHFSQSEEYSSDKYNNFYSTQSPRRYKREKRPENSGQRSQYNPNSHKITGHEENFRSDERNSSENNSSKEIDKEACALHCFMENLQMIGDDGMPDKYLVTDAITKNVKNEDLKDFLQESIEECFQILNIENNEEKCEFSKNLLMCLSEKGRANCDDWKDDLKF